MHWFAAMRRSSEIAFIRRRGRRASTDTLVAYAASDSGSVGRLAVTVSKSVGGAVARNLVRRRIRGALEALPAPRTSLRMVIVAKPAAAREPYVALAADVASALRRLIDTT